MKKLTLTNAEFSHLREIYQTELEKAQKRIEHLSAILKKLDSDNEVSFSSEAQPLKGTNKKTLGTHVNPAARSIVKGAGAKKAVKIDDIVVADPLHEEKPKRGRRPKAVAEVKPKSTRGRKPKASSDAKIKTLVAKKPRKTRKLIKKGVGKKKVKWNDFIVDYLTKTGAAKLSSEITREAVSGFKIKESDKPRVRLVISGILSKLVTADKVLRTKKIEGSREKLYGLANWFNENGELLPSHSPK
jgi:hypothetical protein